MFGSLKPPPEPPEEPKSAGNILDPRLDESVKVVQWRTEILAEAGYPIKHAVRIAQAREIDLHRAADLLRGCGSVETALAILL